MSVKMEKPEKNTALLEIEVAAETFENAMQKSYLKNIKHFNIPGFRKGKAPRKMVEKMYGKGVFYDDAINFVFPDVYQAAVKETGIEPVDSPEVDIKQFPENDLPLILTAKVTIMPEVTMGSLDDIKIEKPDYTVTDDDVDAKLAQMQEKNARIVEVTDRAAQNGDTVLIDFEGFIDDVAFEGGKGENYSLELGSGQFIPGFEEQLVGKSLGDDAQVNVAFPEDYHASELAGKPAVFKVKINAIKIKELPALDDEFVKDVSEFDTLDELKVDTLNSLKDEAEKKADQEMENLVIEEAVKRMEADIPEVMYENQIDDLIRDFNMRLSYQGMNTEKYLQYTGMDEKAFREQFKERAERQVRSRLALEAIAKSEKFDVTADEIAESYKKMAEEYKMEMDKVKQYVNEADVKNDLLTTKTIKFLLEKAATA